MRHGQFEDGMLGPLIYTEGEDIVEKAWEAKTAAARTKLARKALDADLDNIDAYFLLSEGAPTLAERIALLREAVRVGERLFAPILDDPEAGWWGFIGTRPFLRAIQALGLALEDAGDLSEAEAIWTRLLEMNPNDNQGARGCLVRLLMARASKRDLKALLKRYPDDGMLEMQMAALWLALGVDKPCPPKLWSEIAETNPHVLRMLVHGTPPEDSIEFSPYGITMGGEDEAYAYCVGFAEIWANAPDRLNKIRSNLEPRQ